MPNTLEGFKSLKEGEALVRLFTLQQNTIEITNKTAHTVEELADMHKEIMIELHEIKRIKERVQHLEEGKEAISDLEKRVLKVELVEPRTAKLESINAWITKGVGVLILGALGSLIFIKH